jgi:hypothetical protein
MRYAQSAGFVQEHVDEASPVADANDNAAGEEASLLLNFANSAAMSSATQAVVMEPGVRTTNKINSSDQDGPPTQEICTHHSIAPNSKQAVEDAPASTPKQQPESVIPAGSAQNPANKAPESEACRLKAKGREAVQRAVIGMDCVNSGPCGGSDSDDVHVREMAADMLVRSLVSAIAQQAPDTELPADSAMMSCLNSFSKACIGSGAPTESELRAAVVRCKQRTRATLAPCQSLTAVRA